MIDLICRLWFIALYSCTRPEQSLAYTYILKTDLLFAIFGRGLSQYHMIWLFAHRENIRDIVLQIVGHIREAIHY